MLAEFLRARTRCLRVALVFCAVIAPAFSQTPVTTWHYDNARTGANPNETILAPANVNKTQFGLLFTQPVDGAIVGQALYLPAVNILGTGVHNVVYVATMNDSVYAFDADSASGTNAQPLWQTSLLPAGAMPVPVGLQGCGPTTKLTQIGVLSTPVIDPVTGTLYVVAKTYENSAFVHRLHALDLTTGLEKAGSPIVMANSYSYNGTTTPFADAMQMNRPALLLEKGILYIAFGSNGCRGDLESGWVMAYQASTLQPTGAFDDEPLASAAAIWMRGGGLSADPFGNVYGATADGDFTPGIDFGQSVLKLSRVAKTLKLADWFTPYNELYLDNSDLDMSEPVLILPNQPGHHRHLALTLGKEGTIYVLNRDNMGHFCATCTAGDTQVVQELPGFAPEPGALVYWNNSVYTTGAGSPIKGITLQNGVLSSTPFAQSQITDNGHSPVLSANGTTAGILWQITGPVLTAFDAGTLAKLYSSAQAAGSRDALPPLPHFANLVVANGKVYVGTNNSLVAYGLLSQP